MRLTEVRVGVQPLERFASLLGEGAVRRAGELAAEMRRLLTDRVVWNVNSTAVGGGVAEMLPSLLSYTRAAGIDTRWLVIRGHAGFFAVTKRLHHALHGSPGDGSALDGDARRVYEGTLEENAREMAALVRPGDFVILHDPQTAGLAPALRRAGCRTIWRCHIGSDRSNAQVELGWRFLAPYLAEVEAFVFSRAAYVPAVCDSGKARVITPSIDAFSPKNQPLGEDGVRSILRHTGLVAGPPPPGSELSFTRDDGTASRVSRHADVVRSGPAPDFETPLVVQVSRWDPLKDPIGVMQGFARLRGAPDAQLVLAGPDVRGVSDDPEGARTLEEVREAWRQLPENLRARVHLASLPIEDVQENAAIVNALQRHATVMVQKSLREGFGLTVTEAMWKARPVIGSAVGGIQDQIEDEVSGLLLRDPQDLDGFAAQVQRLLGDAPLRARLGEAARERVREHFLGIGHLVRYAELLRELAQPSPGGGA